MGDPATESGPGGREGGEGGGDETQPDDRPYALPSRASRFLPLPPPPLLRQQFFFDASSRFLSDPSGFGLLTLCGEGLHNDGYRVMRERSRKGKKWRLFGCGEDGRHGELMVIINYLIYR